MDELSYVSLNRYIRYSIMMDKIEHHMHKLCKLHILFSVILDMQDV